jgi:acyl carrier protein
MFSEIVSALVGYVYDNAITFEGEKSDIPVDRSIIEEGIIDSYAMIEMIAFMEGKWEITITDEDFTAERMGSINKMAHLINNKLTHK